MGGVVTKEDQVEGGSGPLDFTKKSEKPKDQVSTKFNSGLRDNDEESKKLTNSGDEEDPTEGGDLDSKNFDPKTAGPIFPDGSINWDCPCLGGAAYGPCGTEFRDAFSCFHFSKEDPKGSECFPQFREMHTCFSKYPELYKPPNDDDDDEEEEEFEDREDEIQFDEDELKVINEEADDNKKDTKEKKETEEKAKSEKEKEAEKPSGAKKPAPDAKKLVKREEKVIVSGAGQPAVM